MKRTFFTFCTITFFCPLAMVAQQTQQTNPADQTKAQQQVNSTVINHEMIDRFNACETSGEYLTWMDLVTGFDNQSLSDLYLTYRNADLETESLADIKKTLEDSQSKHLLNISNISESELAWYVRVKQEINNKLSMSPIAALE